MLTLIGWFFTGGLISRLSFATIVGAATFGYGVLYGYSWADKSAEIAGLQNRIATLSAELQNIASAAKLAEEQAVEVAKTETANDETAKSIRDVIEKQPVIDNCMPAAFLDRLRILK